MLVLIIFYPVVLCVAPVIYSRIRDSIDKIPDYQLFAHNINAKEISDAVREILKTKETIIKIKHNPIEQDYVENIDFDERCVTYFEENFESLAKDAPIVLP